MRRNYMLKALCMIGFIPFGSVFGQNPGLLISEFLQNPGGTDSPFEYVELLATDNIDFSITPYTVIVSNNGTATLDGWVAGGALTYAFEISSGVVSIGDVIYVGGTSMSPQGTKLRVIDTGVQGGDGGIGDANSAGVIGNGGANADGIAVFNLPASSINSSTVPTDAVIFGTGIGTAEVNGGLEGYQLPINDLYNGGKLNSSSVFVVDADLTVASGMFDLSTNTFVVPRSFTSGPATETSEILFGSSAPVQIGFSGNHSSVNEDAGVITLSILPLNLSAQDAAFELEIASFSTAQSSEDYSVSLLSFQITSGQLNPIEIEIEIHDDEVAEQTEYVTFRIANLQNAEINGNPSYTVYILDNDRVIPMATNELKLELLTSFSNGSEGLSSAEITAYDSESSMLFIANSIANRIDFVDFQDPTNPILDFSYEVDSIGAVNSIAAYVGVVIVALENLNPQENGYLLFLDTEGNWLNRIEVGPMPDMVTFNHAKNLILVANEGEPSSDYSIDPEGSISVITYSGDPSELVQEDVLIVDFNEFDGQENELRDEGIRIFGPGASVSQDFEPEYISVSADDQFAYVSLQENNALAVLNLATFSIEQILPLGTIDHSQFGFGMDVSNTTNAINIANFPVKGMFMPDAISTIEIEGATYILTANEGDARDYSTYSEEIRIRDMILDPTAFPDADLLQRNEILGRLNSTTANGDIDGDGDFDEIYTYGTRSFSIWDANGNLVFDSGDLFEQIIANDPVFVSMFNTSNTGLSQKNRSDDKGPEPEGVETTFINGIPFAFVSLERIGGVMLFNISNPVAPVYLGYYNNRDLVSNGPDKGAEGLLYISAEDSPNGQDLLILSNEVSSSLTIFQINSCQNLSGLSLNTSNENNSYCDGSSLEITATSTAALNYEWTLDNQLLENEVSNSIEANEPGIYVLNFSNEFEACSGSTPGIQVTELDLPEPTITSQSGNLVTEEFDSYEWTFGGEVLPNSNQQSWEPQLNGDYTVIVTDQNGCTGHSDVFTVQGLAIQTYDVLEYALVPNPANDQVQISSNKDFGFVVIDSQGAQVMKSPVSDFMHTFSVSEFSNGIYFIQMTTTESTQQVKLVVHH